MTVRRTPKLLPFLGAGALLGLALAMAITRFGPQDARYGMGTELGALGVVFGLIGALFGAVTYLVADARARRRP